MRIESTPQRIFNKNVHEVKSNIAENKNFVENIKSKNNHNKLDEEANINGISNKLNIPKSEDELSIIEQITKHLIQNIFSMFNQDENPTELFPTKDIKDFKFTQEQTNPYSQSIDKFANGGFIYESTQEFYSKTTIDFSTQATIKTPKGEYNIELNISFTHEFYAKETTQISFDKPFELELDRDDERLTDIKHLHLIFDINEDDKDKNKDLFDHIKELLKTQKLLMLRQMDESEKNDLNPLKNDLMESFKIWQKEENEKVSLLAAGQDGIGVFFANAQSNSSYIKTSSDENGFSYEAGYSSKSVSSFGISMDIKA